MSDISLKSIIRHGCVLLFSKTKLLPVLKLMKFITQLFVIPYNINILNPYYKKVHQKM
jgi:hypothetical protein